MNYIKTIVPIFFGKTRSFWLGVVPTAVTAMDLAFTHLTGEGSGPTAGAVAAVAQVVGLDWTGDQVSGFMQTLYPLYLLIFAQQRGTFSGAIPRPWTLDPAKEKTIVAQVENGKTAFEAGKQIGKQLKASLK